MFFVNKKGFVHATRSPKIRIIRNMNKTKPPKCASIYRFKSKKDVMTAHNAQQLRDLIEPAREQMPPETYRAITRAIEKSTASLKNWSFIMLETSLNRAVVNHMTKRSKMPLVAVNLWAMFLDNLRTDTCEILLTRQEMADQLGQLPCNISRIISEFAAIKVIRREKKGGRVFYFLNPWVATHLTGEARDKAQDNSPMLSFDYEGFFECCFEESKNKKAASDEVVPENDLTHEVSTSMREAVPTEEAKNKPKRGRRGLKVIKGGLTSTMENMSSALAVHFPNPFDEAKKALKDMAVKSYAAVMADPIIARDPLYFLLFLLCYLTWIATFLSFDVQGISVLRFFGFY